MPQTIDWSNVVYLSEKMADDYSRFDLNQGDIVLSLDRPLVSAGLKVARINSEDLPAILVQRVGRFISKKTANEDFLYLFLNSDTFIRQITGHDQSIGVPHISPQQVMSVVMPLPDVTKQTQITKWLDDKFFATSIAEASIQQELDTIEAMPAALLRKAFSGGL
jgi:type I restriction enzyme S subunit